MDDQITTIAGSVVQHGRHNRRIYVMHLRPLEIRRLIPLLDRLAVKHGYDKILAKVPETHWRPFRSAGYEKEAVVPGFFQGSIDGLFAAKFFSERRQLPDSRTIREYAPSAAPGRPPAVEAAPSASACTPEDAPTLANIYGRVFASYAFPIHRPGYLRRMMLKNAAYFCIRVNRRAAAAAAAEVDADEANCEMTDFATLPEYRGRGLAAKLLRRLDKEARTRGIKTAYTIARADSRAMNRIFAKAGYRPAGRLVNNTQIDGRIRSMNVWYKHL
ncbi:MAG TPA: putative beta-lysine N-acetyltransferase [Desulfosarcina sp.]|nr:putative beta-lysine N-acetyltransferase [Desulfosarcina sp.]